MKEYKWNNMEHNLEQFKECPKCQSLMRLEAYENTAREVRYQYECTFLARFSSCGNVEEVNNGTE